MFSIVVPAHNLANQIERCVASVLSQAERDTELVLIDDGSTDSTGSQLDKLEKSDCRVIVVHQKNMGQSAARNQGLAISKGRYVIFLDGDDALMPGALGFLRRRLEESEPDVFFGAGHEWNDDSQSPQFLKTVRPMLVVSNFAQARSAVTMASQEFFWNPSPGQMVLSRNFLARKRITFEEGMIFEDNLFAFDVLSNASKIIGEDVPILRVFRQTHSTTRGPTKAQHLTDLSRCVRALLSRPQNSLLSREPGRTLCFVVYKSLLHQLIDRWLSGNIRLKLWTVPQLLSVFWGLSRPLIAYLAMESLVDRVSLLFWHKR